MDLEIIISFGTFTLAAIIAIWRMNASNIKRMDEFNRFLCARMDAGFGEIRGDMREFRSEVRTEIKEVRGEIKEVRGEIKDLHGRLDSLKETVARLDSRLSNVEGMLRHRPWEGTPVGNAPPLTTAQE